MSSSLFDPLDSYESSDSSFEDGKDEDYEGFFSEGTWVGITEERPKRLMHLRCLLSLWLCDGKVSMTMVYKQLKHSEVFSHPVGLEKTAA